MSRGLDPETYVESWRRQSGASVFCIEFIGQEVPGAIAAAASPRVLKLVHVATACCGLYHCLNQESELSDHAGVGVGGGSGQ